MSISYENDAEWDDELDGWVFYGKKKYNFERIKHKLECHFEDGGSYHMGVIAGVLGVTRATIYRWKDPNHNQYKPDFACLLDQLKEVGLSVTDKWHRENASGRLKDANSQTLNRRAANMLEMSEKIETTETKLKNMDENELDEKLKEVEEMIANLEK